MQNSESLYARYIYLMTCARMELARSRTNEHHRPPDELLRDLQDTYQDMNDEHYSRHDTLVLWNTSNTSRFTGPA